MSESTSEGRIVQKEKMPSKSSVLDQVTMVMVHFRTPDLLQIAVESFFSVYPGANVWIIDNGSASEEVDVLLEQCKERYSTLRVHRFSENKFHGPAMDFALRNLIETPYALFLDSDTKTQKDGFLEEMLRALDEQQAYAIGQLERVNDRGFKDPRGIEIPLTPYFLIRTELYNRYPAFIHHGQPTLAHFTQALQEGQRLLNYPIEQYIEHRWRGTASRFGYQLGWKARLDYLLHKFGL